MKQLILIIPSALTKNFNYNVAKKNITSYIGTRLIDTITGEMPGIISKEMLDEEDKQAINDIVFPDIKSGIIAFIELDEENCEQAGKDYLSAKAL